LGDDVPQNKAGSENPFARLARLADERGSELTIEGIAELSRNDPQAIIECLVESAGSIKRFDELLLKNGNLSLSQGINLLKGALVASGPETESHFFSALINCLRDADTWKGLATDPGAFDKELDRIFTLIRRWMKLTYALDNPAHRPAKNASRNQEIYHLKVNRQDLTFGEIGRKFKCSDKVAERAFKRHQEAEKKKLRDTLNILFELKNRLDARGGQPSPQKAF
jgi:hypothetical protein